jgi:hypothetical protein
MYDDALIALLADRQQMAVARRVPLPFTAVVAGLVSRDAPAGLVDDQLWLDRHWRRDETGPFGRSDLAPARALGTLRVGRRCVPVELEVAPWSDASTEVIVRPAARAAHHWSARRRRRWYPPAHAAVDALRKMLTPIRAEESRPVSASARRRAG